MGLAGWGRPSLVSVRAFAIIRTERFPAGPISWSHFTTLPITITATAGDHFRAETPGGPVEASSLRELGDRLRDFLAALEDESASDLVALARLSRSATDQATLLEGETPAGRHPRSHNDGESRHSPRSSCPLPI
jgi:hypothetical protein